MWQALLGDLILSTPTPIIAARFHKGLAKVIVQMISKLADYETGDDAVRRLLFQAEFGRTGLLKRFRNDLKRPVLKSFHRTFPANDGGSSLGQAVIAAANSLEMKRGN